jgi:type I restriction enzyme S subunit
MKQSGVPWIGEIPEHWELRRLRFIFNIKKNIAGKLGFDVLSITQRGIVIKILKATMDNCRWTIQSISWLKSATLQ